ncbi:MAG: UvrD-helicase domain-containing protein [Nocardioides sp.]
MSVDDEAAPEEVALGIFSIRDPLPTGTTLLEASAGTGKTWTIGALVTRFIADGVAELEHMLIVTFGRAASQELRERVRAQLVEAEGALDAHRATGSPSGAGDSVEFPDLPGPINARPEPNELIQVLLDGPPALLQVRHRRIRVALASFDAATIATTHQFCSLVLDSLGVAGDTDSQATLVEDLQELMTEVVDDLYLRAFAYSGDRPTFSRAKALEIARVAVTDSQSRLEPATPGPVGNPMTTGDGTGPDGDRPPGSGPARPAHTDARKVAFAHAVRTELDRRKRRLGILSYDDLLSQLAQSLQDEGSPARVRIRNRWQIVLVDEFQDTDPVQWQVLDRAFSGHATMVLIGDPKQAIYAFRGGDVHTYLAAARSATTRKTLGVNWRTDATLVKPLLRLLEGAALGHPDILVRPVAARHPGPRLVDAPHPSPLRLRVVRRDQFAGGLPPGPQQGSMRLGPLRIGTVRHHIAADLAADIRHLLAARARFDHRELRPSDIAVIAHRHSDLAEAKAALDAIGIPAVIAGGGSVFATPAAAAWLTLLEGLEQPHRVPRVRAAALTAFLGHTAAELDAGGDSLTDDLAERLREWADLWRFRGIAAVLEAANARGLTARVLSLVDGERQLTDLRHLGEALYEVARADHLGVVALVAWLRDQITRARAGGGAERTRRLDSDAAAVQLVTIHASKGLQYPVVYLPSLADRHVRNAPPLPLFHDADGRRCRDVAEHGPDWDAHLRAAKAEDAGESLRLLYVAMTRAQSQVVAWWAPSVNAPASALQRLILGRAPGARAVPDSVATPTDDEIVQVLARWRDTGGPVPELSAIRPTTTIRGAAPVDELRARPFTRRIDPDWRRTSYSALTALAHSAPPVSGVSSEPEVVPRDDESIRAPAHGAGVGLLLEDLPAGDRPDSPSQDETRQPASVVTLPAQSTGPIESTGPVESTGLVESPMATLPVGARFGSLVHAVLEHADPAAPDHGGDLAAELAARLDQQLVYWPVELDRAQLVAALIEVCDTPLGPLADMRTLRGLPLGDRLCELDFELPLSGGDLYRRVQAGPGPDESGVVCLGDVAELLRRHLPAGDPIRSYADTLAPRHPGRAGSGRVDSGHSELGRQKLVGYLTGSIDLVMRIGERYLVVDYKTNWLGAFPEVGKSPRLHALDYRPHALNAAMVGSDYPLQALLYAVVLHRFLRWRVPDYNPAAHLGGVLYLYVRGMCGPDTPVIDGHPCGVFSWRPPATLIEDLSNLLDGSRGPAPAIGNRESS